MSERLPAHIEAGAIMRRAEAEGGFATVLRKGDPDRGAMVLILRERGRLYGLLERELGADFTYGWVLKRADDSESAGSFDEKIRRKAQFDADSWLIELDIATPERFIAETTASG